MNEFGGHLIEEPLSSRELEIVRLLAVGLSNREIAQKLILNPETIKWYNEQIYGKLGVKEQPNQPVAKSLGRHLGRKQMLLVLDNFEHVLDTAPLVSDLLATAPRLTVLVTSQETMRLNGEHEYPVPPLVVPSPGNVGSSPDLAAYESVTLFVQRARAVSPGFLLTEENASAVAAICRHLDGLLLAIELAAARIKLFGPRLLLERLESRLQLLTSGARDLPARQRNLRDTIDWSYNLLGDGEQKLFAWLGAFTGGRAIEAVEAVFAPGLPINLLNALESLLNKSLLYQEEGRDGEPRFVKLETIHEYAAERLANSGVENEIRANHRAYFLAFAEEMEPGYRRHNQLILLEGTVAEKEKLRAASNWASFS